MKDVPKKNLIIFDVGSRANETSLVFIDVVEIAERKKHPSGAERDDA